MEDKAPAKAPEGKAAPVVPGTPKPEQTGPEPVPGTSAPSLGQGKAEPTGQETPTKATPDKAAPGKVIPIQGGKPTPGKGGPSKGDKAAPAKAGPGKGDKPIQGKETPAKGDKPAPGKDSPGEGKKERDKLSQSGKGEPKAPGEAPAEPPKEEPKEPPRPADQGKLVWLKLSEVHPFHTFRPHPFQVRKDAAMRDLSESIKEKGVLQPGTVRPEKDGNGYEIIAGHRRTMASEMAGLEEMPFFVREMTDHEAVQEMKDSNKQRPEMLPTELAALLALEVEDIKHQGGRLAGVAEGDKGKRSVEIVGEAHGLNYKKVMRYIRLNSLIPEFKDLVDGLTPKAKKMGFMPAVELSYLTKKHQQMVLISMEGEQVYPCKDDPNRIVKRIRYVCYGKTRKQTECDGPTGYTAHILDDIVDKLVRRIFERMRTVPKCEIVNARYREKMDERKTLLQSIRADYNKAAADLETLRGEVIKAIHGESAFSKELLGSLIAESEIKCTKLQEQLDRAEADYSEGKSVLDSLNAQYDDMISWADMYDTASMEAKRMIVNCLIKRVEVFRDYKLHIDFNIDLNQFNMGLDLDTVQIAVA